MKARYFRDESIFDAKERKYQSYGWSSLLVGIALLKKGTRFTVGDGKSIRVDKDSLLDTHPPRPIRLSRHTDNITKVCNDGVIWNYNKSGDYTVRSGYWLHTHDPHSVCPTLEIPHGSLLLKNKIWKLPIQPKIKHFLWKALSKALATATRLRSRGVAIDIMCPRCRRSEESINHVLFTCPFTNIVWRLAHSPSQGLQNPSEDLEENLNTILELRTVQGISKFDLYLPFWLLWRIWKSRNNFVFNQYRESPSKTVVKAQAEVKEWLSVTNTDDNERTATPSPVTPKWSRPPFPFVKCNFDASYNTISSRAQGGWLIRDHFGFTKCWTSASLFQATSPLEAEARSCLAAIQHTWARGYTNVIFEGNFETLIKCINGDLMSPPSRICSVILSSRHQGSRGSRLVLKSDDAMKRLMF
ncbi:Ribonuclease H domain [Arabidopsis suecica]|uniref:Ribonuclease H domain n=1 Tax=Arabidopsis suecica TaxID=45249 RepID=A0A8T2CM43_ARASU|nr:Ribonuclease H domain [Arabidopsis suecica]